MKRIIVIITIFVTGITTHAQNIAINNTATASGSSARLDISNTSKGLLLPGLYYHLLDSALFRNGVG